MLSGIKKGMAVLNEVNLPKECKLLSALGGQKSLRTGVVGRGGRKSI